MLYNPIWEKPSLDGFISFLESKPRDEEYFWADCGTCAIGQYFKSIGKVYGMDRDDLTSVFAVNGWEQVVACPLPHTFGGALDRARRARESRMELEPCR